MHCIGKNGNSQEAFPVLWKEEAKIRISSLTICKQSSVKRIVSKANAEFKYRVISTLVRPSQD